MIRIGAIGRRLRKMVVGDVLDFSDRDGAETTGKTYIASLHRTAVFGLDMIEKRMQMPDAQVWD